MVGCCDSPAFTAAVGRAIDYLRRCIPALEALSGLPDSSLRLPDWNDSTSVHTVKEFCVGLLETPDEHAWSAVLAQGRVTLEHRMSIAGTLFLARKMLPVIPSPWESHMNRVCVPGSEVPDGYLSFVRRLVKRELGHAWDQGYDSCVSHFCPPLSSCLESTRKSGGSRARWVRRRRDFFDACFGLRPLREPKGPFPVKFMNVELDGKSRSVTVASWKQHLLGPLHRCLYDAVSRKRWLLRGKASRNRFSGDFARRKGEVFVSGDYESATDNLPLSVAEAILMAARELSVEVPDQIWDYALHSLRSSVQYPDGVARVQLRGQLMGNLLSFPLLCLQNYAAFRWCVGDRKIPVRINGDDIVFRSDREIAQHWMDNVSALGLTLSRGKTLVSSSVFSLNSTFFRAREFGVDLIPVLRGAILARQVDVPHALSPGLRSFCEGFRGEARTRAEVLYLCWQKKWLTACGRSLLRDLHMVVSTEALIRSDLMRREAYFLQCTPCPLPMDQKRMGAATIPDGWRRVSVSSSRGALRRQREAEACFFSILTDRAWAGVGLVTEKRLCRGTWDQAVAGSLNSSFRWWSTRQKRWNRLRGEFRLTAKRFRLSLSSVFAFEAPKPEKKVWAGVPDVAVRPGLK